MNTPKKQLPINTPLVHKMRGVCNYSKMADYCETRNPDPSSIFVEFPDGEIDEVSVALIEVA